MDQNALQVFAILAALAIFGVLLTLPKIPVPKSPLPRVADAMVAKPAVAQGLAEERLNRWSVRQVAHSARLQADRVQAQ